MTEQQNDTASIEDPFREAAIRDPAFHPRTDTERVYAIKTIFRLRATRKASRHPKVTS